MFDRPVANRPAYSVPSLIAIASAIGSFFFGSILGFILAVIAILAGLLGVLLALSPSVRGGLISIVSIGLGLIGIIAAIVKIVV